MLMDHLIKWGAFIGLMLMSPENHCINCALRFGFKALNNEAEYKALILRLHFAREMRVEFIEI